MSPCPHCDRREEQLLTRAAVLALCLRRTAAAMHVRLGHPRTRTTSDDWMCCEEEPCASVKRALRYDRAD